MQRVFPERKMICCSSKHSKELKDDFRTDFIFIFIKSKYYNCYTTHHLCYSHDSSYKVEVIIERVSIGCDQRLGKSSSLMTGFFLLSFLPFPLLSCFSSLFSSCFLTTFCPKPRPSRFSSSPVLDKATLVKPWLFLSLFFLSYLVSITVSFSFLIHSALMSAFLAGPFCSKVELMSTPLLL